MVYQILLLSLPFEILKRAGRKPYDTHGLYRLIESDVCGSDVLTRYTSLGGKRLYRLAGRHEGR